MLKTRNNTGCLRRLREMKRLVQKFVSFEHVMTQLVLAMFHADEERYGNIWRGEGKTTSSARKKLFFHKLCCFLQAFRVGYVKMCIRTP